MNTSPSSTEAEQVVAKLTEAQRKWLPHFGPLPIWWFPVGMARATRARLVAAGLLEERTVNPRDFPFPMRGLCLTPLGLQVRALLTERSRA